MCIRDSFPPGKIDAVAEAIADHMGLWRDEPLTVLESQVLWDADKLAKIGLTAVFHWTGGALAGSRMHTLEALIRRARANEWLPRTVASMHTPPARRAALGLLRRSLAVTRLLGFGLKFENEATVARDQRLQALLRGGVAEVVHPVQVERSFVSADVLLGLGDARIVDATDHVRRDQRGKDAEDHDDDHDFDQRKAAQAAQSGKCHVECRG